MYNLDWRAITPSNAPAYTVKGTRLNSAIVPGHRSRFVIYEIRTIEADKFLGVRYVVADAETVSDADVKAGKSPAHIFSGELDAALDHIKSITRE